MVVCLPNRRQPEFRGLPLTSDMHMHWLVPISRKEEEPVGAAPKDCRTHDIIVAAFADEPQAGLGRALEIRQTFAMSRGASSVRAAPSVLAGPAGSLGCGISIVLTLRRRHALAKRPSPLDELRGRRRRPEHCLQLLMGNELIIQIIRVTIDA